MNKKNMSLIACGLLFSASSLFAESTIKEAIEAGKVSGDVTVNYEKKTEKAAGAADYGFTAGTLGLAFETGSVNNFNAKVGFRAGHEFAEEKEGDFDASFANNSLMTEALIKYTGQSGSLTVGRQEIDLEWLGDYNEAVVAQITAIKDITITAGFSKRQAEADGDDIGAFTQVTQDGVYVLDVKHNLNKNITVNPYFYSAVDVADIYGIKASFSNDMFGIMGHYAATNEDVTGTKDGNIAQLELNANVGPVSLVGGFITTNKDGAIGSMATYGDNIDPTEEIGDAIYGTDADSFYATVSGNVAGVDLGLLYANSEYKSGSTNKELDEVTFTASHNFSDELNFKFIYSTVDGDTTADEYDKVTAAVAYSF